MLNLDVGVDSTRSKGEVTPSRHALFKVFRDTRLRGYDEIPLKVSHYVLEGMKDTCFIAVNCTTSCVLHMGYTCSSLDLPFDYFT